MSDIYLSLTETPSVVTLSQPVVASVMVNTVTVANVVSVNVVTMPAINVTAAGGLTNAELRASAVSVAVTTMPAISISSVTISNFPASQTISGTVTVGNTVTITGTVTANPTGTQTIAGTVTVGNSVTIGSLPAISGTVTVGGFSTVSVGGVLGSLLVGGQRGSSVDPLKLDTATGYLQTKVESMPAISGTVTANLANVVTTDSFWGTPAIKITGGNGYGIDIAGTDSSSNRAIFQEGGGIPVYPRDNAEANAPFPIAGTVTANLAKPTWTDYSGSVTTAGTAVTAISGTSRSYLLAQVTTGQMFLNIGATATTSNSVYFSAGQGFAWETTVPQGIVSIISTVTGTKYVLKSG
jgi:hypothetical protein